MNGDLEELRELGSGTFGTVYHGKWRGTDVAIKRINDRCFSGKASEQERMVCPLPLLIFPLFFKTFFLNGLHVKSIYHGLMLFIREMISGMRPSSLLTCTIQMW